MPRHKSPERLQTVSREVPLCVAHRNDNGRLSNLSCGFGTTRFRIREMLIGSRNQTSLCVHTFFLMPTRPCTCGPNMFTSHDLLYVLSYRSCSHHKYSCRLHVDQTCSHHMMYYMYNNKNNNNNHNSNKNNKYSCDGMDEE